MNLIDVIAGAVPILVLAWIVRLLMRRRATDISAAVISILIATCLGYVIRSFMEGEGGFESRVTNIISATELPGVLRGAVVALALTLLWRVGKIRGGGNA